MLCRPFLHPTENTVLLWGRSFALWGLSAITWAILEKACLLSGTSVGRYTLAVRDASKDLRCALRRPFNLTNVIYTQDLLRIINGLGWEGRFALVAFTSFLFSIRVPSVALFLRRARPEDRISEFAHQGGKVHIGTRRCAFIDCLIIKMSWRKNLAGGCILIRDCLCSDDSSEASKICPPRRIWRILRSLCAPDDLLFPGLDRRCFDRILKFALTRMEFHDARKYSDNAFRLGAAQELLTTGNSLEFIKGSGVWWGGGFRSYVDLEMDHDYKIAKALIALIDSVSPDAWEC